MTSELPRDPLKIVYPSSDGERIAEHTLQFNWISLIWGNLTMAFAHREDVFVAADNLIYPVEGDNQTREAPDIYVAFGRPKGDRDCYRVWDEGGVFPQVVFEVRPPNCRAEVIARKRDFYERNGALEYYDLDPFGNQLIGYYRDRIGRFFERSEMDGFISPFLNIRFEMRGGVVKLFHSDREPFRSLGEWIRWCDLARRTEEARREVETERKEYERLRRLCLAHGLDPDRPPPG